jgi:sialic acid synthase SpsE
VTALSHNNDAVTGPRSAFSESSIITCASTKKVYHIASGDAVEIDMIGYISRYKSDKNRVTINSVDM